MTKNKQHQQLGVQSTTTFKSKSDSEKKKWLIAEKRNCPSCNYHRSEELWSPDCFAGFECQSCKHVFAGHNFVTEIDAAFNHHQQQHYNHNQWNQKNNQQNQQYQQQQQGLWNQKNQQYRKQHYNFNQQQQQGLWNQKNQQQQQQQQQGQETLSQRKSKCPTCSSENIEQKWASYYDCNNCGSFFQGEYIVPPQEDEQVATLHESSVEYEDRDNYFETILCKLIGCHEYQRLAELVISSYNSKRAAARGEAAAADDDEDDDYDNKSDDALSEQLVSMFKDMDFTQKFTILDLEDMFQGLKFDVASKKSAGKAAPAPAAPPLSASTAPSASAAPSAPPVPAFATRICLSTPAFTIPPVSATLPGVPSVYAPSTKTNSSAVAAASITQHPAFAAAASFADAAKLREETSSPFASPAAKASPSQPLISKFAAVAAQVPPLFATSKLVVDDDDDKLPTDV